MIQGIILEDSPEKFNFRLSNEIAKGLLQCGETNTILTQLKEADADLVEDYILMNFQRADGQYVFYGEFYQRREIYEKIKPYCKGFNISIVPKERKGIGNQEPDEQVKQRFGYINYTEINNIFKE